jgi:hypothetical protein
MIYFAMSIGYPELAERLPQWNISNFRQHRLNLQNAAGPYIGSKQTRRNGVWLRRE